MATRAGRCSRTCCSPIANGAGTRRPPVPGGRRPPRRLRWALADLRRALGPAVRDGRSGDGDGGTADVGRRAGRGPTDDGTLPSSDGDLLEGVHPSGAPTFESWLVVERHRLSAAVEARLRRAALRLLADGAPGEAVGSHRARSPTTRSRRATTCCWSAASPPPGTTRPRCGRSAVGALLRRELGIHPSPALADGGGRLARGPGVCAVGPRRHAARGGPGGHRRRCRRGRRRLPPSGRAEAERSATARSPARRCWRSAAPSCTRSVVADDEGAVVLHEAIRIATEAGDGRGLGGEP